MKITADKIDQYPGHAISHTDVRLILSSVPPAWSEHIKVVRLSSSRSPASVALYAHMSSGDTLTIASRGQTKESALHRVLAELAAHHWVSRVAPFSICRPVTKLRLRV